MRKKTVVCEDKLRSVDWEEHTTHILQSEIRPAEKEWDEEIGEYIETDPGVSEVFGYTFLRGQAPWDRKLQLKINWIARGETRGIYENLYDFEVELDGSSEEPATAIEEITESGKTGKEIIMVDEAGAEDYLLLQDTLEKLLSNRIQWEKYVFAALPSSPGPEAIESGRDECNDMGAHDAEMKTYILSRDDARDVRFQGVLIAGASSYEPSGPRQNRWSEIGLYRTRGGKWVAQVIGRTQWQGERDRYSVIVAEEDETLIQQLGTGRLAKEVYERAGIDAAESVD